MIIIESGERARIGDELGGDLLACAVELYEAASDVSYYEAAESPQYSLEAVGRGKAKDRLRAARERATELGLDYELRGFLIAGA